MKNEFSIIFIVKEEGEKGKKMKICFIAFKIFIITLFGILSGFYHFYKNENFHEPTGKPVGLIFKINLIGTTCKTDRISLALSE